MTQILALTKTQSNLLADQMPENIVQLQHTGKYILTSVTLIDSVDFIKFFHAGVMVGINSIHNEAQLLS